MADFRYKSPDAVAAIKKNLREMLQVWLRFGGCDGTDILSLLDSLVNIDRVSVIKQISDQWMKLWRGQYGAILSVI
jgi:hypothetical protein